ncbi:MAG: phage baseplate assembly protein V, partial [Novosphingobium sp.]|nr:phage baseplate assembly protein V [Novosphingobium sp.]
MNAPCPNQNNPGRRFHGKYRGKVIENIDPLFQGRIIADVPSVPGSLLNWAMPCTPYAGPNVGFYAVPPIGANVWIEFEGGDPGYPVWVGCFWGPTEVLHVPEPVVPELKVFKTEYTTIVINDLPEVGGFSLKCNPLAVDIPLTMTFDSTGITINCPESTIRM